MSETVKTACKYEWRSGIVQFQIILRNQRKDEVIQRLCDAVGQDAPYLPMTGIELDHFSIFATGPSEYWMFADPEHAEQAIAGMHQIFGETASVFDQSAGRVMMRISGENAKDLLMRCAALDLEAPSLPAPGATHTIVNQISTLIVCRAKTECFDLSVPRSYADSFEKAMQMAALDLVQS